MSHGAHGRRLLDERPLVWWALIMTSCVVANPDAAVLADVSPEMEPPAPLVGFHPVEPRASMLVPTVFDGWIVEALDEEAAQATIALEATRYRVDLRVATDEEIDQLRSAFEAGGPHQLRLHPSTTSFASDDTGGVTPDCRESAFGMQDLERVLERSRPSDLRGLLGALPSNVLQKFTLLYESRSPQVATAMRPRVVRFDTQAKLVLAYGCEDEGEGGVEVLAWDDRDDRWSLHRIRFDGEGARAVGSAHIEDDPVECLSCHGGSDPRPNWASYPIWTGAYGSNDDRIGSLDASGSFVPDAEGAAFLRFRQSIVDDPCYSTLPWPDAAADHYPYSATPKLHNYHYRPNASLAVALSRLAARRLARRIADHPDFEAWAPHLAAEALDCDVALPLALVPTIDHSGEYDPWSEMAFDARARTSGGPLLYRVAQAMGVRDSDWTLDFHRDLRSEDHAPVYITASWPMPRLVQTVLIERWLQRESVIADPLPRAGRMQHIFGDEFACLDALADHTELHPVDREAICEAVHERVSSHGSIATGQADDHPVDGAQIFDRHCGRCHDELPDFATAEALTRVTAAGGCEMPADGHCLAPAVRRALLGYLHVSSAPSTTRANPIAVPRDSDAR